VGQLHLGRVRKPTGAPSFTGYSGRTRQLQAERGSGITIALAIANALKAG